MWEVLFDEYQSWASLCNCYILFNDNKHHDVHFHCMNHYNVFFCTIFPLTYKRMTRSYMCCNVVIRFNKPIKLHCEKSWQIIDFQVQQQQLLYIAHQLTLDTVTKNWQKITIVEECLVMICIRKRNCKVWD